MNPKIAAKSDLPTQSTKTNQLVNASSKPPLRTPADDEIRERARAATETLV